MKRNLLSGIFLFGVVVIMIYASTKNNSHGNTAANFRQKAPDFELQDLNGRTVHLSDFRGKAVVLNFWATWCPPCREEIPWFIELQKQYGSQGLQIVGVSMDEGGREDVERFAKEMGINYTVLLNDEKVSQLYGGVNALPTTFYLARDGQVMEYVPGLISHYEVEQNIKQALASPVKTESGPKEQQIGAKY